MPGWTAGAPPPTSVQAEGGFGSGRFEAIFAQAALDSLYPDPAARLRFRGLDAEARYQVAPVFIGPTPSGLVPPEWWGQPTSAGVHIERTSLRATVQDGVSFPGAVFAGGSVSADQSRLSQPLTKVRRRHSPQRRRRSAAPRVLNSGAWWRTPVRVARYTVAQRLQGAEPGSSEESGRSRNF